MSNFIAPDIIGKEQQLSPLVVHTFVLYEEDISLLEPGKWISDQCIEFWWDHAQQIVPDLKESRDGMIFICPSAMHMVNFFNSDADFAAFNDLQLKYKQLILMPINDNQRDVVGGTHWALLCYHRPENKFFFYDSARNLNLGAARRVSKKMESALGSQNATLHVQEYAPQQKNGADCGIYMILNAELIGRHWASHRSFPGQEKFADITPELALCTRKAVKFLAHRALKE